MLILMNYWWRSSCAAVPSLSDAFTSGAATFVVTTNNDTIILQPAEDSISNAYSIGVTPTTRFGLQTSPVRFTKTFIYSEPAGAKYSTVGGSLNINFGSVCVIVS